MNPGDLTIQCVNSMNSATSLGLPMEQASIL
jgi:hypothetical protein